MPEKKPGKPKPKPTKPYPGITNISKRRSERIEESRKSYPRPTPRKKNK